MSAAHHDIAKMLLARRALDLGLGGDDGLNYALGEIGFGPRGHAECEAIRAGLMSKARDLAPTFTRRQVAAWKKARREDAKEIADGC